MAELNEGMMNRMHFMSFLEPEAFHWPGYMWLWQDRMSRKEIDNQLADLYRMGARSNWILPLDQTWRTYRQPTELEPGYMTEAFNMLFRETIKEAERLGMRIWLNDEPGFPSGGNVGRIVRAHPELIERKLLQQQITVQSGESCAIPKECIAAFTQQGESEPQQMQTGEVFKASMNTTLLLYFMQTVTPDNRPNYPDLLNPDTAGHFISQCYEMLKTVTGEYFGNTIPIIFFDEPKVQNPPWTDDLAEAFTAEKGYDIRKYLYHLFDQRDAGQKVRIDFTDWWSNRLAKSFFTPIRDWCRMNKIFFTGHFDGDDYTLGNRDCGYGSILRLLRKTDIPCVDVIWRQIWPGRRHVCNTEQPGLNHHFPKYASTAAHQTGSPWAGTECFAVYGSGLTPDVMKWITDYQFVRGINLMTMSNALLSSRDYFMGRIRPVFLPGNANPLTQYMDLFHSYTARLSYLLSRGEPVITTALYFPVRDIWAGGPDSESAAADHDQLARVLLENQCDFDLIDDDVLEDDTNEIRGGELMVGPMTYNTIVLAPAKWLGKAARRKIEAFIIAGGKVIWTGDAADEHMPQGANAVSLSVISALLNPLVNVRPVQNMLRVCKRRMKNGSLYFLFNEDKGPISCTVSFNEQSPLYVMDAQTGRCWQSAAARRHGTTWTLSVNLPFAGSSLILFSDEELPAVSEPTRPGDVALMLKDGWQYKIDRAYRIGLHHFEVENTTADYEPIDLGDWTASFGSSFSGDVSYRNTFPCTAEMAVNCEFLDLGRVHFACTVKINGITAGRRSWEPYHFPIAGMLRAGTNELVVTVSNSMANQYVHTTLLDKWPINIIGPYHEKCLVFERETVNQGSGLFGPVNLCHKVMQG